MAYLSQMCYSLWDKIGDIVSGFFAIIPQIMYFIFTSIASLLDMFQYVFRKVAGLDVYYVNGKEKTGDVVIDLIEGILGINKEYSALTTVFWSMIIFGVILLILMTILSIIKIHYNYKSYHENKKDSPFYVIKLSLKALASMALIPLCTMFGLYLSTVLFRALDSITTSASNNTMSSVFESDAIDSFSYSTKNGGSEGRVYASYDFFGYGEWTNSDTFSGIIFKACANDCNRVRKGAYTPNSSLWDNAGVFYTTSTSDAREIVAKQIDYAFANNLKLNTSHTFLIDGKEEALNAIASSLTYGPSLAFAAKLVNVTNFSKYNVGLVWYFYNLWGFNFIIAFASIALCIALFGNILFGMFMRIIISGVLFIIYPAVTGIMPFDEGRGLKSWRKEFISYLISSYASILAMNIFFLILPVFNSISFFNNALVDGIANTIIIIAGLTLVKRFIGIVSQFVGAKDLNEIGEGLKKEAANPAMKAAKTSYKFGSASISFFGVGKALKKDFKESKTGQKIINSKAGKAVSSAIQGVASKLKNSKLGVGIKKASVKVINFSKKLVGAGQKAKDKFNKVMEKTPVKYIAGMLGVPVDAFSESVYEDVEETDENGNVVIKKKRRVGTDKDGKPIYEEKKKATAIIKNAFVDFAGAALKLAGNVTGLSSALKTFEKNTGIVSDAKGKIDSFAQSLGLIGEKETLFKKDQEQKLREKRKKIKSTFVDTAALETNSRKTLEEIKEIVKNIK